MTQGGLKFRWLLIYCFELSVNVEYGFKEDSDMFIQCCQGDVAIKRIYTTIPIKLAACAFCIYII